MSEKKILMNGHDPLAVANFFIAKNKEASGIGLMKLIKLCYFSHGFTLANLNKILINEYAEAWKYGPVFPTIFHEFKTAKPISELATKFDPVTKTLIPWTSDFNDAENSIMRQVNEYYGVLSGGQLSTLTHREDTAWSKAWIAGEKIKGFSIDIKEIKKEFDIKVKKAKSE